MSAEEKLPNGGPESRAALSRFLRILLIVSLALNMFFIGAGAVLAVRAFSRAERFYAAHPRAEFPGPRMMLRALPEATRERIEEEIGPEREAMRAALAAARRARREAYAAFAGEPFSAEIYRQKLDAAEAADLAAVSAVHKVVEKAMAQLTPEERAQLVDEMKKRRLERGGRHRFDGDFGPPPPPAD